MKRVLFFLTVIISLSLAAQDISVMSFNIRYDNSGDGENAWPNRRERASDAINFYAPDIIGTQEVLHHQLVDILDGCPHYDSIGVGRQDGNTQGEYSAILYNKKRFEIVDCGWFWLSETPEIAGAKGWDAACERIATWAILRDKESKAKLFALNTHFDHIGQVARAESARLILNRIAEMAKGMPVVVTGDFNADPADKVIEHLTAGTPIALFDCRNMARVVYGPDWTFHNFDRLPMAERKRIDYVFVTENIEVERYGVLAETNDGYLSDHNPVLVYLSIK